MMKHLATVLLCGWVLWYYQSDYRFSAGSGHEVESWGLFESYESKASCEYILDILVEDNVAEKKKIDPKESINVAGGIIQTKPDKGSGRRTERYVCLPGALDPRPHFTSGEQKGAVDKALNELQADTRAVRGMRAAALTAKIKAFEDAYNAQARPALPGAIGQMLKNKEAVERAQGRDRIKKGEKPADVLKDIQEQKAKKREQLSQPTKDIQELGRRLQ
jgi:hypothetical protein